MNIDVIGIVVDQFGGVLAIKSDNTQSWRPPSSTLHTNESPIEGTKRAVEEATGLKIYPVRLVAVQYANTNSYSSLHFTFRCLLRGGDIKKATHSLDVGYISPDKLAVAQMSSVHRQQIEQALTHHGGAPIWGKIEQSLLSRFRSGIVKHLRRSDRTNEVAAWTISSSALICNKDETVLWEYDLNNQQLSLPGGKLAGNIEPWFELVTVIDTHTNLQITVTDLSGVYLLPNNHIHLVWLADVMSGTVSKSNQYRWHDSDVLPIEGTSIWSERAEDALNLQRVSTQFKCQEE